MEELVKTFQIEWKLVIAQLVNFGIVLYVLYKFAYGPILKTLNERTKKIDQGIKDAEEASQKMVEMSEKEKAVLSEARKSAQEIIAKSDEQAKKNKDEIMAEAKAQAQKAVADAQKKIEEEKNKMMAEVKGEIAGLVMSATEKLIEEKMDAHKDKELIEKSLK